MTDTPSPTTQAAQEATSFERGVSGISLLGLIAFLVIAGLKLVGLHLPGAQAALYVFLTFWGVGLAFQFCRHLIALNVFQRHIAEMERDAFMLKLQMDAMREAQEAASEQQPVNRKDPPADEGTVIDLMSRLHRTDDEPKA